MVSRVLSFCSPQLQGLVDKKEAEAGSRDRTYETVGRNGPSMGLQDPHPRNHLIIAVRIKHRGTSRSLWRRVFND